MPTPSPDESRDAWLDRCIPALIEEGNESDQAQAVCISMWEERSSAMAKFPEAVTRNSVDSRLTEFEEGMLEAAGPDARPEDFAESAHEAVIAEFKSHYPGAEVPEYIQNLGQKREEILVE